MKLCFSTLCCPSWTLQQIIDAATASQVDGIDFRGIRSEIDITRLPEFGEDLQQTIFRLSQVGLGMPCLNTSIVLVTPAPERWHMMLDECQRYAHLAAKCRSPYLRVFGGSVPKGMSREEARVLAQRHLRQLAKITRPCQCLPLLETHDDWATSEQILELMHEFEPADAAVLWDLEHPWRHGEDPLDTAQGLRKFIRHVHIKDSTPTRMPTLLGLGDLPLQQSLSALRQIDYTGWFSLETEKRWQMETAPEPEQSIPQFAHWMRENWTKHGG